MCSPIDDFAGAMSPVRLNEGVDLPAGGIGLEKLERHSSFRLSSELAGTRTKAAALLGLNRDQIRYRIEKFQLQKSDASRTGSPDCGEVTAIRLTAPQSTSIAQDFAWPAKKSALGRSVRTSNYRFCPGLGGSDDGQMARSLPIRVTATSNRNRCNIRKATS
jgi:hypothetical protein